MTQEKIRDYTLRISQANASDLVVIIYELLLDTMKEAKQALKKEDKEAYKEQVRKCERYVQELLHGLNYEDEIAVSISHDYVRVNRLLIKARLSLDASLILTAEKILTGLKPTFDRIADEDTDAPVMANTQKVYAGLTYGKTSLSEIAIDPSANRGYTV